MKYRSKQSERGQAAIIITMILSIVMGMIVLGLTFVDSASDRSTVSNLESIQAKYAAESGVNDVITALKQGTITIPPYNQQNCSTIIDLLAQHNYQATLSTSPNIAYTCIYAQNAPSNLQFSVNDAQSSVVELTPSAPTNSLKISWQPTIQPGSFVVGSCNPQTQQFVSFQNWICPYAPIRMDIYKYNATDASAAALNNDTDPFILFPVSAGVGAKNNITFDTTIDGVIDNVLSIVDANCNASTCTATLNFAQPFTSGYARFTSLYGDAGTVTVSGDSGVSFADSQLEIDATGEDQSVIQRIDVRVPLSNQVGTAPNYALDGGADACKRYTLVDGEPDPNNAYYPPFCADVRKPAIYLYPTKPELVNVKVNYAPGFIQTIPSYNSFSGWTVLANPSGSLYDPANGQQYPYLYWEGAADSFHFDMSRGFVVAGADSAAFLRHELPIIGLNPAESAAFISYWVPLLQSHPYNLIHFAGNAYTALAPLQITPQPNSLLRVFMAVEPLQTPVSVTPQTFPTFHRVGFTVVEWGGSISGDTSSSPAL